LNDEQTSVTGTVTAPDGNLTAYDGSPAPSDPAPETAPGVPDGPKTDHGGGGWGPDRPGGGGKLLDDVRSFVRHYVVLGDDEATAVALWVVHTHAIEAFDTTPYLHIRSAEKQSGKSTLLDVLKLLVREPLSTTNISDAALFRAISLKASPTLLFDEVDAIFGPRAREREDLRSLINAGFQRGAHVYRMGGQQRDKLEEFEVFCSKALSGIGRLPDTIEDRSIGIELKRKIPGEEVKRFRKRPAEVDAAPLKERIEQWVAGELLDHDRLVALVDVGFPDNEKIPGRAMDIWEPLLWIAHLTGERWSAHARLASVALSGGTSEDESLGVKLLADCRDAFDKDDRLSTTNLIERLAKIEESPWGDWPGRLGFSPQQLAKRLKPFGILPRTIWFPDGQTLKGYRSAQFEDAWRRYLPSPPLLAPETSGPSDPSSLAASAAFDQPSVSWQAPVRPVPVIGDDGYLALIQKAHRDGFVTQKEVLDRWQLHNAIVRSRDA
jgi:hypothetical protein